MQYALPGGVVYVDCLLKDGKNILSSSTTTKNMKNRRLAGLISILLVCVTGKLFAGGDLYLAYSELVAPIGDQSRIATVVFSKRFDDIRIDGVNLSDNNMRSVSCGIKEDYAVDLLPGKHVVSFTIPGYHSAGSDEYKDALEIDVEAGNIYKLSYAAVGAGYTPTAKVVNIMLSFDKYNDYPGKDKVAKARIDAIGGEESWKPKIKNDFVVQATDKIKCGFDIMAMDYPERVTWQNAQGFCPQGWRLPALTELQYMYENKNVIGGFEGTGYWTGEGMDKSSDDRRVVVTFDDGKSKKGDPFDLYSVRYVKDKSAGTSNNGNSDGSVYLPDCAITVMDNDLPGLYTLSQAQAASPIGWRLPTAAELKCMCGHKSAMRGFTGEEYWSNEKDDRNNVFSVTTNDGKKEKRGGDEKYSVRLVKETQIDWNSANSIYLSACGIEVMAMDLPQTYAWSDALAACPAGWRLPTGDELQCICGNKSKVPLFNGKEYWSGKEDGDKQAVSVTTNDCKQENRNKSYKLSVRCVRTKIGNP